MADIILPPNVKQDPNTGLYIITNAQGKTVRVNADNQAQLNQYVNSVNTGVPATVTTTDPNTGNPRTRTFDSNAIISERESINKQNELLTAGKRQAGVLGNRDGSYQDLKTGQTISQEQAEAKIKSAGLPPETLAAVTPKNSPAYAAAQQSINQTATAPSNIPPAETQQPSQSGGGNSTSAEVTQSAVPNTTAAAIPSGVFAPTPDPVPQGNSPYASQQAQQQTGIPESAPPPIEQGNSPYASQRAQQIEDIQAAAPASVDTPLLTPAQSIARAQTTAPADVAPGSLAETQNNVLNTIQTNPVSTPGAVPNTPANTGIFANPNFSPEAISGTPAPVNPATDPGVKGPFGGAASNAAAAQNPEAAAAAYQQEQANQAAAMKQKAQEQPAVQAEFQSPANGDWRVRLRLAPNATYLYKDKNVAAGILAPLAASNGVVFPYMPTIQTTYNADYDSVELTHSNYRGQFYKSSYVGDVSITGIFTAQDTAEANYLLAVIHFFRSVTKMFYGAKDPLRGAPPPLVYLIGLGQYQFNNQPCVVKTFNYSMPNDCDYIRTKPNNYNTNLSGRSPKPQASSTPISSVESRLKNATSGGLPQGAVPNVPAQGLLEMQSVTNIADATYVPTKCEIQLTLMPIQTRSQQSQQFSMENFANGNLLKGGFW